MKLAHERAARGFVLFDHERPIAYVFCHAQSENLLYEYIAYDETYAKWSPGTVLLYLLVESLFREQRFERLDLGEGTLGYKSFFATDATPCVRVIYSTALALCDSGIRPLGPCAGFDRHGRVAAHGRHEDEAEAVDDGQGTASRPRVGTEREGGVIRSASLTPLGP